MPPRKASGSRGRGGKHGNASHLQHQLPVPASYPGLVEGKGLAESQWNACREILEGVYKAKDGNRRLVDIFRELPDKEEYEDYYQAIPEPECLDNISAQLEVQHYPNPEAFFKQLHLVFLNAKHYNEEESLLWSDAKRLEDQIHSEWTARAEAGVFTHPDPYHSTAGRPRKKRGTSTVPSKSATPLPDTTTKGTPGRGSVPPTIAETKAATPAVELPTILEKEREQESSSRASTSSTPLKVKVPIPTPLKASTPNPKITTASAPPPAPVQVPAPIPAPAAARTPLTAPVAALSPIPKPQLPTSAPVQTLQTAMQRPSTPSRVNSQPTTTPASPSVSDKARQTQAEIDRKVVAALDAVLPRWPGPQPVIPGNTAPGGIFGSGWFGEGAPDYERSAGGPAMWPHRIRAVVDAIASYRDQHGYRLAEVLDILPVHAEIPYLSFHGSISFASINDLAKAGQYSTLRDFDIQMTQLFEKARRYFHDGSVEYGSVLVLQRLYNALTAVYPMPLPASGIPSPSPTLFASLPAGPGNARSLHETTQELKAGASEDDVGFGITTFRVGTKDRQFTDEARHKGISYKLGDYVHLINPDDATRPIIGQIFKTFVPTKGYRTHHVTVCWYFRPEQTVHTPDRRFYEREVFKTGHFCDHPVEDILEKISVQFYVKYIRGRPRAGEYYPGWPIYICHSRFNDREYLSVRIKNWNSCIPDELRQTEFMSVIPFERNIEVPMVSSPFLRGVKGPGFFGEPKKGSAGDDEDDDEDEKEPKEKEKPRRRERAKRDSNVHAPSPTPQPPSHSQPAYQARPTLPKSQSSSSSSLPTVPVAQSQSSNSFPNRTIAAVMGGPQLLDQTANKEVLPPDTARLFDRDARGNVLWFSGPPLPTGSMPIPTQQAHSLEYLAYLTKRKRGEGYVPLRRVRRRAASARNTEKEGGEDPMVGVEPTPWWAEGQSQEEVEASLWAVIESA
ncbi:chromatin structure-remodeling complex subunit RSC1/2 [Kwoniella heveanensis CBS 569]|nr:chromatin structure-remodeling complex subunit RSC1/2 [Kwoniella heveanensis CBS 569]